MARLRLGDTADWKDGDDVVIVPSLRASPGTECPAFHL